MFGKTWIATLLIFAAASAFTEVIEPFPCPENLLSEKEYTAHIERITIKDEKADLYYRLGWVQYINKDLQNAINSFMKTYELTQDAAEREKAWKMAEFISSMLEESSLTPSDVLKNVKNLISAEKYEKAQEILENAVKKFPENRDLHYYLACIYLKNGENKEAFDEISTSIKIDPAYAPAHIVIAEYYEKAKDFENALISWRKASELGNDALKEQIKPAMLNCEYALRRSKIKEDDAEGFLELARWLEVNGNEYLALQEYSNARKADPKLRQAETAVQRLTKSICEKMMAKAEDYYKVKKRNQSIKQLESLISKFPDTEYAKKAKELIKNIREEAGEIEWMKSTNEAIQKAKEENKLIMFYFYLDDDKRCKKMDDETFSDKEVVSYLIDKFICFRINGKYDKKYKNNYNVSYFPTMLYVDYKGKEIQRYGGFSLPSDFLAQLEYVNGLSR